MAGGIFDHIVAVVLIGAIFGAAVFALPNVGYVGFLSVDQQQLRNVALSALNTMLLDAGYPLSWGSVIDFNQSSLVRFGLASAWTSELYVLDTDKVQKLVGDNPEQVGYISYDTVRQLLGLQAYGFRMRILAPFNASVVDRAPPVDPSNPTDQELRTINYEVTVRFNDGKPVPNAVVNGLVFYSVKTGGSGQNEAYSLYNVRTMETTDELGKSLVATTLSGQVSDVMIVMEVTVGDVHTVSSTYRRGVPLDIADINVVGDTMILTMPPEADPNDDRWILTVHAYTGDGEIISVYNGTQQDKINWGSMDEWIKSLPGLQFLNPVILIFNFRAVEKGSGRKGLIVVGPFPGYLGNRVLSFGAEGGLPPGATGVALSRVVSIAGMTYSVEFMMWKVQY